MQSIQKFQDLQVKSYGVEGASNTAKQEKINQKTYEGTPWFVSKRIISRSQRSLHYSRA